MVASATAPSETFNTPPEIVVLTAFPPERSDKLAAVPDTSVWSAIPETVTPEQVFMHDILPTTPLELMSLM